MYKNITSIPCVRTYVSTDSFHEYTNPGKKKVPPFPAKVLKHLDICKTSLSTAKKFKKVFTYKDDDDTNIITLS